MPTNGQIIGASFSTNQILNNDLRAFLQYVVEQLPDRNENSPPIKFCFIPTASNDSYFQRAALRVLLLTKNNIEYNEILIEEITGDKNALEEKVSAQDIFFVGGGVTHNLITIWQQNQFDIILWNAHNTGKIISGINAGIACWFTHLVSGSHEMFRMCALDGLNWIQNSCSLHYQEESRSVSLQDYIRYSVFEPGFGLEDGIIVHFVNQKLHKLDSTTTDAKAVYIRHSEPLGLEKQDIYNNNEQKSLELLTEPQKVLTPHLQNYTQKLSSSFQSVSLADSIENMQLPNTNPSQ
jgi:dipeptidase E